MRTCDTRVQGDVGDWHTNSIMVGPLAFPWIKQASSVPKAIWNGNSIGWHADKELAVVQPGRTVTVSIPAAESRYVSLLYDPDVFGGGMEFWHVYDGERSVTFKACPGHSKNWNDATQFAGGFIVAGARCASLDVRVGASQVVHRVVVSFGMRRCPAG